MNAAELLRRKEMYLGGDLELQADGSILRGPIKDIRPEGYDLVFDCDWLARMQLGSGKWLRAENKPIKITALLSLGEMGNNRLVAIVGDWVLALFPKGGSKLLPEKVVQE